MNGVAERRWVPSAGSAMVVVATGSLVCVDRLLLVGPGWGFAAAAVAAAAARFGCCFCWQVVLLPLPLFRRFCSAAVLLLLPLVLLLFALLP